MMTMQRGTAALAAMCLLAGCATGGGGTAEMRPGTAPAIRVGQTISGRLADSDPVAMDRGHFRAYRFEAAEGQRMVATVESEDFDTYLTVARLIGPVMDVVKQDDDGGEGTNSRARFTAPAAGSYLLVVQGFDEEQTGGFAVTLALAAAATGGAPRAIASGQSLNGELSDADLVDDERETSYDVYTFAGRAGQRVTLQLKSDDFDTYLRLGRMQDGQFVEIASDDDGGGGEDGGTDSQIRQTLREDGEYVVHATSFGEAEGGYTLRMEERAPAAAAVPRPVQAGVRASGVLTDEDPVVDTDGSYYDYWTYAGRAGERLRIELASEDFDAFVALGRMVNGAWTQIGSNDDGGSGTDSLLEVELPADGEYVIRANAFGAEETGDYTLLVTSSRDR